MTDRQGGRTSGTPNKNSKFLLNRLKDIYGEDFDPVMAMAQNAVRVQQIADKCFADDRKVFEESEIDGKVKLVDKIITANNAIAAWDRIAKYTTPQLKSIELINAVGEEKSTPWSLVAAAVDNDETERTTH